MNGTILPCRHCGYMKYQHSEKRLKCPVGKTMFESQERCTFCPDSVGWIESDAVPGTYYPCTSCNINKHKPLPPKAIPPNPPYKDGDVGGGHAGLDAVDGDDL